MKTALTIAGSDSSGGAGIQADLKTFLANGVYGMSVITSVTSQNTTGVYGIFDIPPETVTSQLDAVFTDIFPNAVKIGMVSSVEIIGAIANALKKHRPQNVVLDPVMVSTSGSQLISEDAKSALIEELFPLADIITPNLPEAEALLGKDITSEDDMVLAAQTLAEKYKTGVLVKGGHLECGACDILVSNSSVRRYASERINNPNTHGTGCTLSSAIAANLAKDLDLGTSVMKAKEYVTDAIRAGLNLGEGRGPLNHGCQIFKNWQ